MLKQTKNIKRDFNLFSRMEEIYCTCLVLLDNLLAIQRGTVDRPFENFINKSPSFNISTRIFDLVKVKFSNTL